MAAGASSQTSDSPRDAFAGLNPAAISTGILHDRVMSFSAVAEFDGAAEAPPARVSGWRQLLSELTRASLEPQDWPSLEDVDAVRQSAVKTGVVPLAVLDVAYDHLAPDAVKRGLLELEGGRLRVVDLARLREAFVTERVFAATALLPETYRGASVEFVLRRDLYVTNDDAPAQVDVDFDDGLGPRPLSFGQAQVVHYSTDGTKVLRLRMSKPGGSVLQAAIPFEVVALVSPTPDLILDIAATIPYQGLHGGGEAYCYLGAGHATLVDPVIVVEGFDPNNANGMDKLYDLLNREDLLVTMQAEGYDAVVLNFDWGADYIQRNAMVLVELIQRVRDRMPDRQDMVVIGASMGGLVSRYALAYMEQMGMEHDVRTFISFDSPQTGANIPWGIYNWLHFFGVTYGEASAAEKYGWMNMPAAKQMLLFPPRAEQPDLQTELAALGGFPHQPRTVSIANGSGHGANQGFGPSAQLIDLDWEWHDQGWIGHVKGDVWALDGQSDNRITKCSVFDPNDILDPFDDLDISQNYYCPNNTTAFDGAPGGSSDTMRLMEEEWPHPHGADLNALHDDHCFIPTISALALDTDDPFFDIAGAASAGTLMAMTPFDAVYYPVENQPHVQVNTENKQWFLAEIRRNATAVDDVPTTLAARPQLREIYPNPFNPRATIVFELPSADDARVDIFDAAGRHVMTLADELFPAGRHTVTWAGTDHLGRGVAAGVYFCRLSVGAVHEARPIALIK